MPTVLRAPLTIAAVLFAIAVPATQAILDFGMAPAAFAAQGDVTLRAAGYAFSIWSLIYLGLAVYAVWQALPRNRQDPVVGQVAGLAMVAIVGCGLWIAAAAANWQWASVAIIVVSAGAAILALARAAPAYEANVRDHLFVYWPLGLLAGWLTVASALNITTVLTAQEVIPPGSETAGLAAIVVVTAVAVAALLRLRLLAYAVPIVWGLIAVWVAEHQARPIPAAAALGAAAILAVIAVWVGRPTAVPR